MSTGDESQIGYTSPFLTHFVGHGNKSHEQQYSIIKQILTQKCILPRGSAGNWAGNVCFNSGATPSSNRWLNPDMVCFCDIPLEEEMLRIHASKYGEFGVAFQKQWLAGKGASPVIYIPRGAGCTDHRYPDDAPERTTTMGPFFDAAILDLWPSIQPAVASKRVAGYNLFFWYILSYLKFYDERLPDDDPDNFYMEREWRRLGMLKFSFAEVSKVVIPRTYRDRFCEDFPELVAKAWPS